jgi:hypothetical protein
MGGRGRRSRVEPTDEWEQLALLVGQILAESVLSFAVEG